MLENEEALNKVRMKDGMSSSVTIEITL